VSDRSESQQDKLDLAARAAWLYYIGGKTQDEIASALNISRPAAQRLVAFAVSEKLIKFRLDHPIASCMELAQAVVDRYGLAFCDVVPSDPTKLESRSLVAASAAGWLEKHIAQKAPAVIAVGTGRTLRATVQQISPLERPQHKIVSRVGNMARDGSASAFDVVMRLADRVGGQRFPMPTPVVADSAEERELLQAQRPFLRFFNWLYYVKSRMGGKPHLELFMKFSFEASFTVPPAYLVCGPHGYTIQITFPRSRAREALVELLGICQTSPCPPVTTILRAHRADDHWISFSEDGYSLNFEIHPKKRHVGKSREVVDRLVAAVARYGGKLHLAKDQVLTPEQFRSLYPRYERLLDLKQRLDPEGLLATDLARRVGLCPADR